MNIKEMASRLKLSYIKENEELVKLPIDNNIKLVMINIWYGGYYA